MSSQDCASTHSVCKTVIENQRKVNQDRLVDYSPGDKPWDIHRRDCDTIKHLYGELCEEHRFQRYSERMQDCSGHLLFNIVESKLKLKQAKFCRVRHCPVCQWRRSLLWLARFFTFLPGIEAMHPTYKWIALTLTVRNCAVRDLRETLKSMNAGWRRMIERKMWPAQGFVRTTEVTRAKDGTAHPHFHALLLVKSTYFNGKKYISREKWTEYWRSCAQLNYHPQVWVEKVKPRGRNKDTGEAVKKAVRETLKYSVKPADMMVNPRWLGQLTDQLHKLRFISTGGILKDCVKAGEEKNDELVHLDEDTGEIIGEFFPQLMFEWQNKKKHYTRVNE